MAPGRKQQAQAVRRSRVNTKAEDRWRRQEEVRFLHPQSSSKVPPHWTRCPRVRAAAGPMLRRAREAKNSPWEIQKKRFHESGTKQGARQAWAGEGRDGLIVRSQHPQGRARSWPSERVPLVLLETETVLSYFRCRLCVGGKVNKRDWITRKPGHCQTQGSTNPGGLAFVLSSAYLLGLHPWRSWFIFSSKIKGRKSSWSH